MTNARNDGGGSTPTLRSLIDEAIGEYLASMSLRPEPGIVMAYDNETCTVSVQPLVMRVVYGEQDKRTVRKKAVLEDVPVLFFGAGAVRDTLPIKAGNVGLIVPCDASLSAWLLTGGFVDPGDGDAGRSDVVFVPGLNDAKSSPTSAPTDTRVLHGRTKIGGPSGTQKTIMASSWQTAHTTLITAIATAVGGGGATAINTAKDVFNNATWKTDETEVK